MSVLMTAAHWADQKDHGLIGYLVMLMVELKVAAEIEMKTLMEEQMVVQYVWKLTSAYFWS